MPRAEDEGVGAEETHKLPMFILGQFVLFTLYNYAIIWYSLPSIDDTHILRCS